MRLLRLLLIAAMALLVGCSSAEEPGAAPESHRSSAAEAEASAAPTGAASPDPAEPTEDATSETAGGDAEPASAVFASPPRGYSFRKLPAAAKAQMEKTLRQHVGDPDKSQFVTDWQTRIMSRGRRPVAVVFAVQFSSQATEADMKGFNVGVAEGAGTQGQPVTVGGKDMTYIESPAALVYLYSGDDYRLMFSGARKAPLRAAAAAIMQDVE